MKRLSWILFLVGMNALAIDIEIEKLKVNTVKNQATFDLSISGDYRENPEIIKRENQLIIDFPRTFVAKTMSEKFSLSGEKTPLPVTLTLIGQNKTQLVISLPEHIRAISDQTILSVRKNLIRLEAPFLLTAKKVEAKEEIVAEKKIDLTPVKVGANQELEKESLALNEAYLQRLIQEDKSKDVVTEKKPLAAAPVPQEKKKADSTDALVSYAIKFGGFLLLVLTLFLALVAIIKKGVFRRGRLGFLDKTKQVVVLSTTYIGPKKALVLVKIQDQLLLLGSSDAGVNFISEVKESQQFLKEGERIITGENFDLNLLGLENQENLERKVKEKLNIYEDQPLPASGLNSKINRFSEELKKKVKTLKPLSQEAK